MLIKDVANYIEKLAPVNIACDWDNVGLIVGNLNDEVKKIMVTLDVDRFVVNEAAKEGVNLIVSHHPLMFNPIRKLTSQDEFQSVLIELVKNGISLYSAHTNLDSARGGLNDFLAQKMGLTNTKVLDVTGENELGEYGFGRFAKLYKEERLIDIVRKCKETFELDAVKYCGDDNRVIKTVAVNSGGGSSSMEKCFENNIDLFITGDFKYNTIREAYERGLAVIDAGHYNTEKIVMDLFYDYLSKQFNDVPIIKSKSNIDIVKICE